MSEKLISEQLKSYAYRHVNTVRGEYEQQVGKWTGYINTLADLQIAALERHKKVLAEKDDHWIAGIAMLAFSFVGGEATAWLGKMVTRKLASRYSNIVTDAFVNGVYVSGKKYTSDQAGDIAEFFGSGVKTALDTTGSKVATQLMPETKPRAEYSGLAAAIMGNSLISFKTELQNAMSKATMVVTGALTDLATQINQQESYGSEILREVDAEFTATKPPKSMRPAVAEPTLEDRLRRGKQIIDARMDEFRKQNAKAWFYFGNDPEHRSPPILVRQLEVEIWKLWFIEQDFQIVFSPENIVTPDFRAEGNDRRRFNERILKYLSNDLLQTGLYETYYKVYKQIVSRDIESETQLNVIRQWASQRPSSLRLRSRPRVLNPINGLKVAPQ